MSGIIPSALTSLQVVPEMAGGSDMPDLPPGCQKQAEAAAAAAFGELAGVGLRQGYVQLAVDQLSKVCVWQVSCHNTCFLGLGVAFGPQETVNCLESDKGPSGQTVCVCTGCDLSPSHRASWTYEKSLTSKGLPVPVHFLLLLLLAFPVPICRYVLCGSSTMLLF
jgi:hypothetical protein